MLQVHSSIRSELIVAIASSEGSLRDVLLGYLELMISGSKINLGECRGSFELIEQVVDPWKWILVLDGDFV